VPGFQSYIFLRGFFFSLRFCFSMCMPSTLRALLPVIMQLKECIRTLRSQSHTRTSRSIPIREVNCLSIFTSLTRLIRYMHVLFKGLHRYQSHFLHQSHISSHRIPWNWGSDGCMDKPSAGLSYRSLNATVAQPQTCPLELTLRLSCKM